MESISEIRKRAWKTRREKYGEQGHKSSYWRGHQMAEPHRVTRMVNCIAYFYSAGFLSEGQAAKILGIDRISLRTIADSLDCNNINDLIRAPTENQ